MALSDEQVRHVARLARLALTDAEIESLRGELSDILDYAQQVGQVTADVPPTSHPYPLTNVDRADGARPSLSLQEALANAPQAEDGRFRVPRIVGEET